MRHQYPEMIRYPVLKRDSLDAANWFQKRNQNQNQFRRIGLPRQQSEEALLSKNKDENINRAQTAPAKPKSYEPETLRGLKIPIPTDADAPPAPSQNLNSDRPSTGRLVRQCLKCKVLYTVSHYCPLHSASSPTLLQPLPTPMMPLRKKRTSPRPEAMSQRASPYSRFRPSDSRAKH
jgi:hypothetical protein